MTRKLLLFFIFLLMAGGCTKKYEVYEAPRQQAATTTVVEEQPKEAEQQAVVEEQQKKEEKNSFLTSDISPAAGGIAGRAGTGTNNQRILEAVSKDGQYWLKTEFVLSDQASSPSAMIDKEGRLRVYYMDAWNGGISVAIKDGNNWVYKKVKVAANAADPEVILLSDGKYRMYYFASLFTPSPAQRFDVKYSIKMAESLDGINFEEKGESYSDNKPIGHPDFFYRGALPLMFVTRDKNLDLLKSDNGIKWSKDPDFISDCKKSSTIKTPRGYVAYCESFIDGKDKILSYFSADGRKWSKESVRLEPTLSIEKRMTGNPTVEILDDGSYVMFYTTYID